MKALLATLLFVPSITLACVGEETFTPAGTVYSNTAQVPHTWLDSVRHSIITFINNADKDVKVYYEPTYYLTSNGQKATGVAVETLEGHFGSGNDPLNAFGGLLPSDTMGGIVLNFSATAYRGNATIRWETTECLTEYPLTVSVESSWYHSSRAGTYHYFVNEGKPF